MLAKGMRQHVGSFSRVSADRQSGQRMTEGRRGGRFGVNGAGLVVSDVEVKWVVDAVGTADVLRHGSGGWLAMYASIVVDEDEDRGRISVVVEGVAVGSVDDGKSDDADGGMVADVEWCGGAVAWMGGGVCRRLRRKRRRRRLLARRRRWGGDGAGSTWSTAPLNRVDWLVSREEGTDVRNGASVVGQEGIPRQRTELGGGHGSALGTAGCTTWKGKVGIAHSPVPGWYGEGREVDEMTCGRGQARRPIVGVRNGAGCLGQRSKGWRSALPALQGWAADKALVMTRRRRRSEGAGG